MSYWTCVNSSSLDCARVTLPNGNASDPALECQRHSECLSPPQLRELRDRVCVVFAPHWTAVIAVQTYTHAHSQSLSATRLYTTSQMPFWMCACAENRPTATMVPAFHDYTWWCMCVYWKSCCPHIGDLRTAEPVGVGVAVRYRTLGPSDLISGFAVWSPRTRNIIPPN